MSPDVPVRIAPQADAVAGVYRKIGWRLLPFLLLCYTMSFLDRINIGFAKLQMQHELGISNTAYGIGAGIFFIGYIFFEVPSNLLLPRFGIRKTISRIMILWGLTSACMMFIRGETSFYVMRVLLGIFEAGFVPGVMYYLSFWYGRQYLGRAIAIFMFAGPIGGALGSPISGWIIGSLSGHYGLSGWQWLYLLEGSPCILLGLLVPFVMVERMEDAKWLSADEKAIVQSQRSDGGPNAGTFRSALANPKIYLMSAAYFCILAGLYIINFWLPTIISENGAKSPMAVGLFAAIPNIAGLIGLYFGARRSDRVKERRWHSAIPALLGGVGLAGCAVWHETFWLSLTCIALADALMNMAYVVFLAIPAEHFKGRAYAGGFAMINSIGVMGAFASPVMVGFVRSSTGSMNGALLWMSLVMLVASALLASIRR